MTAEVDVRRDACESEVSKCEEGNVNVGVIGNGISKDDGDGSYVFVTGSDAVASDESDPTNGHCGRVETNGGGGLQLQVENGESTIPTGAGLVVPVELVMMDESTLGGAASEFNPYRFLSKAGNGSDIYQRKSCAGAAQNFVYQGESSFNLNDPDKSTAFLPFGSGVRPCVGQKFVTEGVAMLFASLLRQYEIKLYPEAQDTSKPSNFGFPPLSSLHIVFVERNC